MPAITSMNQLPMSIQSRCCRGKAGNVIRMSRPNPAQFSPIGRGDGFLNRVNMEPLHFSVSVSGLTEVPGVVERFYPEMDPGMCATARAVQDDILAVATDLSWAEHSIKGLIGRFGGESRNPGNDIKSWAQVTVGLNANVALQHLLLGLPKLSKGVSEAMLKLFIALPPENDYTGTVVRTKYTGSIGESVSSVGPKVDEQAMLELSNLMIDHIKAGLPRLLVGLFDERIGGFKFAIDE